MSKKKTGDHASIYYHPRNREQIDKARKKVSFSKYVVQAGVEKAGGEFYETNK